MSLQIECTKLNPGGKGMTMPVEFCFKRQLALEKGNGNGVRPKYEICANCDDGKGIAKKHAVLFDTVKTGMGAATPHRKPREKEQCSHDSCEKPAIAKGLCAIHYQKRRKEKKMAGTEKQKPRCEHTGCDEGQWMDHLCMVHYKEKHGGTSSPQSTRRPQRKTREDSSLPLREEKALNASSAISAPIAHCPLPIALDLSPFPKVLKYITALPDIEPGEMLSLLLKRPLELLEGRLEI